MIVNRISDVEIATCAMSQTAGTTYTKHREGYNHEDRMSGLSLLANFDAGDRIV